MDKNSLPFKVSIASPCTARWEDMGGSDRVRFCDHCSKNVYNLSAMTSSEARALLEAKKGNLCARIYQRPDGTVLTEDCPAGVARYWLRVKALVAGGVAAISFALINIAAIARGNETGTNHAPAIVQTHSKTNGTILSGKVGVTMGICAPPRYVPPSPKMGEASAVTATNHVVVPSVPSPAKK